MSEVAETGAKVEVPADGGAGEPQEREPVSYRKFEEVNAVAGQYRSFGSPSDVNAKLRELATLQAEKADSAFRDGSGGTSLADARKNLLEIMPELAGVSDLREENKHIQNQLGRANIASAQGVISDYYRNLNGKSLSEGAVQEIFDDVKKKLTVNQLNEIYYDGDSSSVRQVLDREFGKAPVSVLQKHVVAKVLKVPDLPLGSVRAGNEPPAPAKVFNSIDEVNRHVLKQEQLARGFA